jgi:hypothetical protein
VEAHHIDILISLCNSIPFQVGESWGSPHFSPFFRRRVSGETRRHSWEQVAPAGEPLESALDRVAILHNDVYCNEEDFEIEPVRSKYCNALFLRRLWPHPSVPHSLNFSLIWLILKPMKDIVAVSRVVLADGRQMRAQEMDKVVVFFPVRLQQIPDGPRSSRHGLDEGLETDQREAA